MSLSKIIFFLAIIVFPLTAMAQARISPKDSVDIKNQIEGFYSWYVSIIKHNQLNSTFNPGFIRRNDGMTTLDFKNYRAGLSKYKFSKEFIERKVSEYKECADHLEKVPFDKFSEYKDLDDFENLNCDFTNVYEWTGGMEPVDEAELSNLQRIDQNRIIAYVDFYDKTDGQKLKRGQAKVTLIRIVEAWRIDDLIVE
jgi:hypothetical protein